MTGRILILLLVVGMVMLASAGQSEPVILEESDQTISIAPYLEPLRAKPVEQPSAPTPPAMTAQNYGLPVHTPGLTPGRVEPRALPGLDGKMVGARPLFLVGADQWSLAWLNTHHARLAELGAVGLVVNVETTRELAILQRAGQGMPMSAASGQAFADALDLQHYPVLIAPPGVVAQ